MSIGLHLCGIDISCDIFGLRLFCKDNRNVENFGNNTGNTDTGCLDRQDLCDLFPFKSAFELFSDLTEQGYIHLMIQKAVHFQHIAFSNLTVFSDSVFEYLHFFILHHRFVHFILIYIISFFNFTLYSLKCQCTENVF